MRKRGSHPGSVPIQASIGITALLLFILALEMMKNGASVLTLILRGRLAIDDAWDSLGLGWLMAYVVLSGSPAAAIAMALLSAGSLTPVQAYTMLTGSRLGGLHSSCS